MIIQHYLDQLENLGFDREDLRQIKPIMAGYSVDVLMDREGQEEACIIVSEENDGK